MVGIVTITSQRYNPWKNGTSGDLLRIWGW